MLVELAETLASSGRQSVLYNFLYSDRGRGGPDPPDVLERTAQAAGDHARATLGARKVIVGGKSMGGRIASQVVARGAPADGLIFLGYPLHPPGRTQVLRDRHLGAVEAPMLFVQGTRDAFARWDLLEALVERLSPRASLHRVEEGDHSFAVPKRTGRKAADVQREVFAAVLRWLEAHGRGYETPGGLVPLVPGAVVYDLMTGDSTRRPGPDEGWAACEAAREEP